MFDSSMQLLKPRKMKYMNFELLEMFLTVNQRL